MTYRLTEHRQTNFRQGHGKVYMTHPTKVLYKLVIQDLLSAECVANSIARALSLTKRFKSVFSWEPLYDHRCVPVVGFHHPSRGA